MLTEANVKRLVSKLSQMRGAALKVGQFLSIQGTPAIFLLLSARLTKNLDSHVLPPELDRVFRMVQDSAHYMPDWQLEVSNPLFPKRQCDHDIPENTR